jgi:hypothetical protein
MDMADSFHELGVADCRRPRLPNMVRDAPMPVLHGIIIAERLILNTLELARASEAINLSEMKRLQIEANFKILQFMQKQSLNRSLRWTPKTGPLVKIDFCWSAVDKKEQTYESQTQTAQCGL